MNYTEEIGWIKNPPGPNQDKSGYSWNPITGCLNGCEYCYARKLANSRVREFYLANQNIAPTYSQYDNRYEILNPFYPRLWPERLTGDKNNPISRKNPIGVFVCNMGDLFGIGVPESWTRQVLEHIRSCPQHRFYLLTKQPQNLTRFSPFPDNAWVGVSYTGGNGFTKVLAGLKEIEAKIKYLSIEPLLIKVPELALNTAVKIVNQIILGACTGTRKEIEALVQKYPELTPMQWEKKWTAQPPIIWLERIVLDATRAGVPVFLIEGYLW